MKMLPVVILAKYYSNMRSAVSERPNATRFPNVPTRARDSFPSVQYYNLILNIPLLLPAI